MGTRGKHRVRRPTVWRRPAAMVTAGVASTALATIAVYVAVSHSTDVRAAIANRPGVTQTPGSAGKAADLAIATQPAPEPAPEFRCHRAGPRVSSADHPRPRCVPASSRGLRGPVQAPDLAAIRRQGHLRPSAHGTRPARNGERDAARHVHGDVEGRSERHQQHVQRTDAVGGAVHLRRGRLPRRQPHVSPPTAASTSPWRTPTTTTSTWPSGPRSWCSNRPAGTPPRQRGHRGAVSPWRTCPGRRTEVPRATWRRGNALTR